MKVRSIIVYPNLGIKDEITENVIRSTRKGALYVSGKERQRKERQNENKSIKRQSCNHR